MNVKEEILKDHSKAQRDKIVAYIGLDTQLFDEFIQLFLQSDYRITQRASWIIQAIALQNSFLIKPYLKVLLEKVQSNETDESTKRNIIRIWEEIEIPEELEGEIYEVCYQNLLIPQPIAIHAFSMTVCERIARKFPELKEELKLSIEDLMLKYAEKSGAITSRGKKILDKLKKHK